MDAVFPQCAKALKRSRLWDPGSWPQRSDLPTLAEMLVDQAKPAGVSVGEMECALEEAYRTKLY